VEVLKKGYGAPTGIPFLLRTINGEGEDLLMLRGSFFVIFWGGKSEVGVKPPNLSSERADLVRRKSDRERGGDHMLYNF